MVMMAWGRGVRRHGMGGPFCPLRSHCPTPSMRLLTAMATERTKWPAHAMPFHPPPPMPSSPSTQTIPANRTDLHNLYLRDGDGKAPGMAWAGRFVRCVAIAEIDD
ncbi:hypothetical protein SUGI_0583090 [Cryptomeria japonica]|nr:hypothetical protein SUGI_0583090 [Cryptomeria japonica]